MTVYVLGAGASRDAGYPLAKDMATELFRWMKQASRDPNSYAARYPVVAQYLEKSLPQSGNIEALIAAIRERIHEFESGTPEQQADRRRLANANGVLQNAVRDWFAEIQYGRALNSTTYRDFASNVVAPSDRVITFNYDVSLERELKHAGKFEIGDGYGFCMEGLPANSKTKVLKLHGSTSWLALLFGGHVSGFSSFQPGNTLSSPVIGSNELSFLGYPDTVDPRFKNGGAALPVMIFPAPVKEFYFDANTGVEYTEFWDRLWQQATDALQTTERVVVCGYSLLPVDQRARDLLLSAPRRDAEVVIASGSDTQRIVDDYLAAGYTKVAAASEALFKNWVATASNSLAAL